MAAAIEADGQSTGGLGGSSGAPALELRAVTKRFGTTPALERADLVVAPGEFVTLLGPSGSGKTTLLRIVVGFERPSAGQVLLHGREISGMSPAERDVGMVFQQYALFPHMTVADNIAYGLRVRGVGKEHRRRRVGEMLDLLRLTGFERRYPRQLSGGQQQRVALGRALAYDPGLILMDEPLGALDRTLRLEMEEEIRRLHRDLRATVVYVTHDQQEALALSDRIAIMRGGRIVTVGTPEALYFRPADAFVASFFANANLLPVARHEALADGRALVECAGGRLECPSSAPPGVPVQLAVRRRSLRRTPADGLRLEGVVTETLLFGDEREVAFEVAGVGRLTALVDARDSHELAVGQATAFYVAGADAVLVPASGADLRG